MTSHFGKHFRALTRKSGAKEPDIRHALRSILEQWTDVREEYPSGGGPCDLYLPHHRVVIETKSRPKSDAAPICDPANTGSQPGETQFDQVSRYVLALRAAHSPEGGSWIGILTDGVRFFAWEWPADRTDEHCQPQPRLHNQRFLAQPDDLSRELEALLNGSSAKPWIPAEPGYLFDESREDLRQLWQDAESHTSPRTQFVLWLERIRGSGIRVAESRQHSLFVDHCFLITLSRFVTRAMDGASFEPINDGFTAWIGETPGGQTWAANLFARVDRFDWGSREIDVLRQVYTHIIKREDRKLYGEYYTPDWLAHMIVEKTLDEDWLRRAIEEAYAAGQPPNGIGVLDPTCGSGTFLYHAARRILATIPRIYPNTTPIQRAAIVEHLVSGIDIHPVAVEMARATLRRAVPTPMEPNVYQGDALLTADRRIGSQAMLDGESSEFYSPDGKRRFEIPHQLAEKSNVQHRLAVLVQSAQDDAPLPKVVTEGITGNDSQKIVEAHKTLAQIIEEHGDGVWAWSIHNQMMPLALARRKVDRIVSNPPWLRWNAIQTEPRKSDIMALAEAHDLVSPKQGGRTSFDIAAVFVVETRNIYLGDSAHPASAYVLNASALSAENWRLFRERGHARGALNLTSKYHDGHTLQKRPFSGAEACVIGMPVTDEGRLTLRDQTKKIDPDNQESIDSLVKILSPLRSPTWHPSRYYARARQGATIGPAILVRVNPDAPLFTMRPRRRHARWANQEPFALAGIPDHWRIPYLRSEDYLPHLLDKTSVAIVPNEDGKLLQDWEAKDRSATWAELSKAYSENVGIGAETPKTLAGLLDNRGQLTSQWPPSFSVLYNKSGQHLKAASGTVVVNDTVYRVSVDSQEEADFLCAVLNAPALDIAFQMARNSDRDFHKTPFEKIPIPLYTPNDPYHRRLAELGQLIREARIDDPGREYPDAYRVQLDGISEILRRILPDFCIELEDSA